MVATRSAARKVHGVEAPPAANTLKAPPKRATKKKAVPEAVPEPDAVPEAKPRKASRQTKAAATPAPKPAVKAVTKPAAKPVSKATPKAASKPKQAASLSDDAPRAEKDVLKAQKAQPAAESRNPGPKRKPATRPKPATVAPKRATRSAAKTATPASPTDARHVNTPHADVDVAEETSQAPDDDDLAMAEDAARPHGDENGEDDISPEHEVGNAKVDEIPIIASGSPVRASHQDEETVVHESVSREIELDSTVKTPVLTAPVAALPEPVACQKEEAETDNECVLEELETDSAVKPTVLRAREEGLREPAASHEEEAKVDDEPVPDELELDEKEGTTITSAHNANLVEFKVHSETVSGTDDEPAPQELESDCTTIQKTISHDEEVPEVHPDEETYAGDEAVPQELEIEPSPKETTQDMERVAERQMPVVEEPTIQQAIVDVEAQRKLETCVLAEDAKDKITLPVLGLGPALDLSHGQIVFSDLYTETSPVRNKGAIPKETIFPILMEPEAVTDKEVLIDEEVTGASLLFAKEVGSPGGEAMERVSPSKAVLAFDKAPLLTFPIPDFTYANGSAIKQPPSPMKSAMRSPQKTVSSPKKKSVTFNARECSAFENSVLVVDGPLKATVFYLDVKSRGKSENHIFVGLLEDMGAQIISKWDSHSKPTHVLFKDGCTETLQRVAATKGAVKCVNVGFALECEKHNKRMDETDYLVNLNSVVIKTPSPAPKRLVYTPARTPSHLFDFRTPSTMLSTPTTPNSSEWERSIIYGDGDDKENGVPSSPPKPLQQSCPPKPQGSVNWLSQSPIKPMTVSRPMASAARKRRFETFGGITMAPPKKPRFL